MAQQELPIRTEYITLDAFLKWAGVAATGGHAKALIASGEIRVNGDVETRRGRKIRPGDTVTTSEGQKWLIIQEEG